MPKLFRVALMVIAAALSVWFVAGYARLANPLYGDALGYYVYLPATFIYQNHQSLAELPTDRGIPEDVLRMVGDIKSMHTISPKGYVLNQYTYGVALMELPFFMVAHAYEKISGGSANGFSEAYIYMLLLGNLIYVLLGLCILYRVLRRHFSDSASFLCVWLIFVGTHVFWFSLKQAGMAHVPLFFLFALLIWLSMKVQERPATRYFLAIGFVAGLITVIRPTDVLCLLIPLLFGVYNKRTFLDRVSFLRTHLMKVCLMPLLFILPIIPQLLYWKWMTGEYIYYSYGGQGFNWRDPRIVDGLFSFSNGWLAYTPLMAFALLGMFLLRRIRVWALVSWLLVPMYIYIVYSWWCWNYINGLGSRPMIHLYPLLAIPLAAIIELVLSRGRVILVVFSAITVFFIALNISNSMQQALGILKSEESSFAYNRRILFRNTNTYKDLVTYDLEEMPPDETKLQRIGVLACEDFEDSTSDAYFKDARYFPGFFYLLHQDKEYMDNAIRVPYSKERFKGAKWLKCSGKFLLPDAPKSYFRHLLNVTVKRGDTYPLWKAVEIINKLDVSHQEEREVLEINRFVVATWGEVWFFVRLPDDVQEGDMVGLEVWNIGKQYIYMDDLCIELYK